VKTRTRAWEEAARSLAIEPVPRQRPDPLRWLGYAFWRPLPDRFRLWVLYDATCSTWVIRHLARLVTVAIVPVAAVAIFLPAPAPLRLWTAFIAGAGALVFSAVWVNEATDYRLERAGWRAELAQEVRQRRREIVKWMLRVRKL
jgi:uncharacterized protein DUF5313